jgi:hypothetical protein
MATPSFHETNGVSARLSDLFGIVPDASAHISDLELHAAERELGVLLPPSYREFLCTFGAKVWTHSGLLGLPRDDIRRDLVLRNKNGPSRLPDLVKFMEEKEGPPFYFATYLSRSDGECPVVRWDTEKGIRVVADSFIHFLEQLASEGLCYSTREPATR